MKFSFNKRSTYFYLLLGIIWTSLSILKLQDSSDFISYSFLFIGAVYLIISLHNILKKYIVIDSDSIKTHFIPYKKIHFQDLIELKKLDSEYIFKSDQKTFIVHKHYIDKKELPLFDHFFNDLSQKIAITDKNHNY